MSLEKNAFASLGKTFRGEIWEDDADVPMGKGYSNEGKPFDINTACYLKLPQQAIRNASKRKVVARAAVQTLKTFGTVEKPASYFIKHEPGDMAIYDCDIEAAKDHAKSRLGPLLKSVPGIADQIAETANRHDISTTEFYLPGMTLRMWPLNESATQRITLKYVFISDAFLSKRTGLIEQAIARTTQHPKDKKIIIESQGSEEGDDFDRQWLSTDQGELHVKCPLCGEGQPFEWDREREDGTFAGFQRGPEESVILPDGKYNESEIIRNTHYECFHCRGKWLDVPLTRAALDASSYYVSKNPTANPENAGFSWPAWINRRLSWGKIMVEYLVSKKADREWNNREPYKQWVQKRAGKTWTDKFERPTAKVMIGSFNIAGGIKDEVSRIFMVDCQADPKKSKDAGQPVIGHFWFVSWAIDKDCRNIYQIARGYAESWNEWIDISKKLKVPNKNVAIDGGHWLDDVVNAAAANWEEGISYNGRGKQFKSAHVWTVMRGNGKRSSFKHDDGVFRAFAKASDYPRQVIIGGRKQIIFVPVIEWSNLSVKDQLFAIRQSQKPMIHVLPPEQLSAITREMEKKLGSYERQISNEYRTRDKGKNIWKESNPNVHYNDDDCMGIVQLARGGLIGHIEAAEEEVATV